MTRNLFSTLILFLLCTILISFCFIVISSAQEQKPRPAHIGILYPLSTNGTEAPDYVNNFSLHILTGVSKEENAFCLSGLGSIIKQNANGAVVSGIYNHIGHNAEGFCLSGVVNLVKNKMNGAAIAGLTNIAGSVDGAQIAGFNNIAGNVEGLQIAGFLNTAKKADLQVAGFGNITHSNNTIQVAGFINQAIEANNQISGFINVAKKVTGVQITGFINIAEESKYPIGLVNIIKNGEKQIGVSIDETGSTVLAFRSGGSVLYGILGVGFNAKEDNARYVLEGGIGSHLPVNRHFRVNLEVCNTVMSDLQYDVYFKTSARTLAALKIMNYLEIFAGPTLNHLNFDRYQTDIRSDKYIWSHQSYNSFNGLYLGAMAGLQITL